ncbi:DUF84 family protein [Escherichia coli]
MAIEAGIDGDSTFSWVVIEKHQPARRGAFGYLPLPAVILQKVREGEALRSVMSRYTGIDEIGRRGRGDRHVYPQGNSLAPASITRR